MGVILTLLAFDIKMTLAKKWEMQFFSVNFYFKLTFNKYHHL